VNSESNNYITKSNEALNKSINYNEVANFFHECYNDNSQLNLKLSRIKEIFSRLHLLNTFENPIFNIMSWKTRCLTNKKFNVLLQYLDEWTRCKSINEDKTNKNINITSTELNCVGIEKNYFMDIITLTETWSTEDKFKIFNMKHYNRFHINRPVGKKGGGILNFIHKSYHSIIVSSLVNSDIEYILVQILMKNEPWHVLTIYRPPNGSINEFLLELEKVSMEINLDYTIITGDININLLNINDRNVIKYFDQLTTLNLKAINRAISRQSLVSSEGSLIDHVIVSEGHENFLSLTSNKIQLMSDHNFIITSMLMESVEAEKRKIKRRKFNIQGALRNIKSDLSGLVNYFEYLNKNEYFNLVHDILMNAIDRNTRFYHVKLPKIVKTLPEWADEKYIEMLHSIHNLEEKIMKREILRLPCGELKNKFNELNIIREDYGDVRAKNFITSLRSEI